MSKAWHHGYKPGLYNSQQEAALHQTKTMACVCVCVLSHEDITKHHTHKIRSQQVSTMTVLCFCSHTRMKANRQYESAQCLSEMFYLCVVHLYEFMCGNDSDECVRLKVQEWGHATVFKNWTSHIHLPFGVFSLLT